MLDFFYSCVGKVAYSAPKIREEKLNFSLGFPNGETQEIEVSKNNYDSYESKRMKLVLDISVLPNDNYRVVSAQNLPRAEFQFQGTFPQRVVDTATNYMLRAIRIAQEILLEVSHLVDGNESQASYTANGSGSVEDRKRKSPRKRLSDSQRRPLRRFLNRVWEIIGFSKPDNILFEPIAANGETSFNTSVNGTGGKHEKRKQPESSDGEVSDDEETMPLHNGDAGLLYDAHNAIFESPQEHLEEEEVNNEQADESEDEESSPLVNGDSKNYLEVEEDYASADDPDYQPEASSPSDSSSDDDDGSESDNLEHLKEEVNDLHKDVEEPAVSQLI